ncbi:uncharacterized protein EI90DRAFT_1835015 [Cantharellus anzutake]|uniref:uncharacterized protein n=1 Tax=Cantharellus anzutake TaxID=1750568 RepID=UPI0019041298|nr:uncharacterized protein EI90DRAFT_1835015 [Cantharellus anzutake]KAF8327254.1 hypothetical protein EI90DRAFT_1835015 [Cantharellus anzutake]
MLSSRCHDMRQRGTTTCVQQDPGITGISEATAPHLNRGAPACSLPDELYNKIFKIHANPYPAFSQIVTFSHVCSRWRSACISTPSLWSHIQVAFPFQREGRLTEIRARLERSTGSLLDAELGFDSEYIDQASIDAVISMLRPHLTRIKRLRISGKFWGNKLFLSCFPLPKGMDHLEYLSVELIIYDHIAPCDITGIWNQAEDVLPSLRTFNLDVYSFRMVPPFLLTPVKLPSLRNLSVVGAVPAEAISFLVDESKDKLEALVLRAPWGTGISTIINSPLPAPRLREIQIGYLSLMNFHSVDWSTQVLEHVLSIEFVDNGLTNIGMHRDYVTVLNNFLDHACFPSLRKFFIPATRGYRDSSLVSFLERHMDLLHFGMYIQEYLAHRFTIRSITGALARSTSMFGKLQLITFIGLRPPFNTFATDFLELLQEMMERVQERGRSPSASSVDVPCLSDSRRSINTVPFKITIKIRTWDSTGVCHELIKLAATYPSNLVIEVIPKLHMRPDSFEF